MTLHGDKTHKERDLSHPGDGDRSLGQPSLLGRQFSSRCCVVVAVVVVLVVVILLLGGGVTPVSVNMYCAAVVLGGYALTAIIIILIGTLIIREQVLPK